MGKIKKQILENLEIQTIGIIFLIPVILLTFSYLFRQQLPLALPELFRDPASVAGWHPMLGFFSNIGVFLWTASTAICLFSSVIYHKLFTDSSIVRFLAVTGILNTLLMLDDFFLLHETLNLEHGINEKIIYVFYGLLFIYWLYLLFPYKEKANYAILALFFSFLAGSVFIDLIQGPLQKIIGEDLRILFEDGFKLLGIVGWLGFNVLLCYQLIKEGYSAKLNQGDQS